MQTDLLNIFFEESEEHTTSISAGFCSNTSTFSFSDCKCSSDSSKNIFNSRSAHTFKGMSASMEFTEMADLTHKMENVLDEIRHNIHISRILF
jgi:two-component system chemotaxis sensor kinase CheA